MIKDGLEYLVDRSTQELIHIVMIEQNITATEAMDKLYNSFTFDRLCDLETHLYYESPAYVYEMFVQEQQGLFKKH